MWEVDTNLALGIRLLYTIYLIVILRDDSAHAKLAGDAETQTPDYGAWTEVGELVGVVAYALVGAVVAVYEGGVWVPGVRGLVRELLRVGVVGGDSASDFGVYGCLDGWEGGEEGGGALADVLRGGFC